jgi:hypothetical protein
LSAIEPDLPLDINVLAVIDLYVSF